MFLKILSLRYSPDLYPILYLYIAQWIGEAVGCLSCNLFAYHYKGAGIFRRYTCPTEFNRQHVHYLLNLEKFKIYIKMHTNIAPTCFGLRPSSGSLYW